MLTIRRLNDRSLRVRLLLIAVATTALVGLNVRGAAAAAAVLYVDRNNPSCSDTGPGTSTQPFCTIKPAASQATAGQTVQVASGTKLAGKSYVTIQGFTVANTSSYGFYVSSSSSNVIVSGNTVSNIASNGIYVTTLSSNVTVSGNTVSGTTSHAIYVSPSSSNVTVNDNQVSGITGYGFWANSSSGVTVSGNTISNTSNYGLHVDTSSNVTVSGNDVSFAGQRAVDLIKYGIKLTDTTNSLVSGNVSHDNSNDGIFLDATTTGVRVTGNEAFGNARGYSRAAPGIDVRGYNNTVDRNISHDNEDSGFQFYTGSHDNLVVDNLSYGNGDHGIDDLGSTNQRIISNTVYDNVAAGINVEGSSTGATIENNIAVDNGINSPRTNGNIRVDSTSTTGTTVNFNLVFLTVPDVMYQWGADKYNSLKEFKDATGQESKGIEADPSWMSPGSNFHLLAGSPAIDSADSGVSGETTTDLEGTGRYNDPDTRDSGAGPRRYDDRGALEFQP